MDKKNFWTTNVGVLAISSLIAKFIGAIYRIPLTNILGVQGIGLYQLVFPLYAFFVAVVCGGVTNTIARQVAYNNSLGQKYQSHSLLKTVFIIMIGVGVFAVIVCITLASTFAKIQNNMNLNLCYFTISPTILIVALSHLLKGWFLGNQNLLPTALTSLSEQIFKLIFGLLLSFYFLQYGLIYAVIGALLGVLISEFLELVLLIIWWSMDYKKEAKSYPINFKENSILFIKSSTPITLSGLVFPFVALADSLLIVNLLKLKGLGIVDSTSQYGILTGPINSLINLPVVVSLALSIAIVPRVSSALANLEVENIKAKTALCIKASFLIAIPSFLGIFILAKPILATLYPTLSAKYLQLGIWLLQLQSLNVVFLSQLEIFNSMLQGLDKSKRVLLNVAIAGCIKIIIQTLLIPYIGIAGACISSIMFYALGWILNLMLYRKLVGKNFKLFENISKILLSSVIMALMVFISTIFLYKNWLKLLVGVLIGIISYGALIFSLKIVDKNTIIYFPIFKRRKND